jgi:maleylacetate reductase
MKTVHLHSEVYGVRTVASADEDEDEIPDTGQRRADSAMPPLTPKVIFAVGALRRVAAEVRGIAAGRVLLIAGASAAGPADAIAAGLGPALAARVDEVVMHVPQRAADAAIARGGSADAIVCVGGGSAIGLGKAVALSTGAPVVAVPTTYAGSEMTSIWGRTTDGRKVTGRDPRVLPRIVVYDPELTVSLPASVSAASGMNALAHCVEGLYAPGGSAATALLAEEGIRALASALPRVVADPAGLRARTDALYGAWLAGWTLGTTGMGVHHKICHVLGGTYDLPHAAAHSAVLPHAAAYNAGHAPAALARAARALRVRDAAAGLWELARAIGAPTALGDLGFRPDQAGPAADLVCAAAPVNPRPVEPAGVRALLRAACAGDRPVTPPWSAQRMEGT